jgi:hypothetical protein
VEFKFEPNVPSVPAQRPSAPAQQEYTFKVTLMFWRFFDIGLNFTLPEVREYLAQEGPFKMYEKYRFEYGDGLSQPLKWISGSSHLYAPVCFKVGSDRFSCKTVPNCVGKLRIEGHIHYGSVLVIHCEFLFDNFHKIEEFIEISQPSNVILESNGLPITEMFDNVFTTVQSILKSSGKFPKKLKKESGLAPWHHTWYIWDAKPDLNRADYRFIKEIGKNANYSIGLTLRTDKWRELDPGVYRDLINLKNLSPYKDEFVMITHAGNVIIPGPGLSDPKAMKNLLIDTAFGPEVGNVQRYLILMHMENILAISDQFEKTIAETDESEKKISLSQKIDILENLEETLNRNILEYNKDIIISKITRLLFTSTFKTSMFNEMIDKLDGFHFAEQTEAVITRIRSTLDRERSSLNTKAGEVENKFLAVLNYLSIFEIGLLILALWIEDLFGGSLQIFIALSIVALTLVLYKNRSRKV